MYCVFVSLSPSWSALGCTSAQTYTALKGHTGQRLTRSIESHIECMTGQTSLVGLVWIFIMETRMERCWCGIQIFNYIQCFSDNEVAKTWTNWVVTNCYTVIGVWYDCTHRPTMHEGKDGGGGGGCRRVNMCTYCLANVAKRLDTKWEATFVQFGICITLVWFRTWYRSFFSFFF